VKGSIDSLTGLNENVIVGRVVPAGTGFPGSKKHAMIAELRKKLFTYGRDEE
jgi:hypothetical protein